ncbi:MAG TPA: hypothetical protein VNN22_24945 [Verrucomicrobiae bacterium]|nr:hypothetical protein [Verrucomicrobiae bacterium]
MPQREFDISIGKDDSVEMHVKGFVVVVEEASKDRSIRLKIRHWEN